MFLFMQQCLNLKLGNLKYNLVGKIRLMKINVHVKYQIRVERVSNVRKKSLGKENFMKKKVGLE